MVLALALTADRSFAACGGTSQLSTGWPGSTSSFGTMATPSSWKPRELVREAGGSPGTLASLQAWPAAAAASRTGPGMPSGGGPARPPPRRASVSPSDSGPVCAHRGRRGEAGRQQDRVPLPLLRAAHHGVSGGAPSVSPYTRRSADMLTLLKPPAETYAWYQVATAPVMGFPP